MRNITICLCAAILTLGPSGASAQTPADRAWTLLTQGAADSNPETRARAVEALGLLVKDDRARRLAESTLSDASEDVRSAAASALGQIGLAAAVPALKAALKDQDAEVVFSATSALLKLGDPTAYQVYYAVLTGQRKTGEPLLQSQLDMLKDPDALARIGFEAGLGFIPFGGVGYKVVKGFTQDKVSPVRAAAAQHLATDPDPDSGRALAAAAADEKWVVRVSAISAIARRGDPSLLPAVSARLGDENETVRFNAAAATLRLSAARPRPR